MIAFDKFNAIYAQHVDDIFAVAVLDVSRREIAEEITREAFLALLESSETLTPDQVPGWLFTFSRRLASEYWLRWYLDQSWADSPEPEPVPAPQHHPEIPFADLLARCSMLKPVHRACLILRFVHGMSRREIASHTGLTENEIKGHLQYGLRLLRDMLASPSDEFPAQELPADA
ncbi:RNA polymerase sigma factor [Edaphobacter aggregans]|uniref:RNA polymerase sigma factor n=1 Tax=Edaphobacter aggregans TaxID=570835 RepID=UPI0005515ECF|nr:sigma-70 family RNA polymerase sigma factor [Edaphobacter aggregans]